MPLALNSSCETLLERQEHQILLYLNVNPHVTLKGPNGRKNHLLTQFLSWQPLSSNCIHVKAQSLKSRLSNKPTFKSFQRSFFRCSLNSIHSIDLVLSKNCRIKVSTHTIQYTISSFITHLLVMVYYIYRVIVE